MDDVPGHSSSHIPSAWNDLEMGALKTIKGLLKLFRKTDPS